MALVATVGAAQAGTGPGAAPRHTLRRGETLSQVAARHGLATASLVQANRIRDPDRVRAGTSLVIPPRSTRDRLPEPLRNDRRRLGLVPHFNAAARRYGVPADLLKAVAWMESGWQNHKVSPTGARGIGQLTPDTVTFANRALVRRPLDPYRPVDNVHLSASYLGYLLRRSGGDVRMAVAAYYQGPNSLRRHGALPTTRRYVRSVLALRRNF